MAKTQQQADLVLTASTVSSLYPPVVTSGRRAIPLPPEILDALPAAAQRAVQEALSRGGCRAYLVDDEHDVVIEVRNGL